MAQIIRKLEKGNKIKKYENPAKELDFSASAITGNSNDSNSNPGITDFSKQSISGNSQTSNLDFSANSIIGKPKPETPKTITFKKNGQNTNWTIDDIKNMMVKVQDRTLANKQLNTKESTEANNWLLQQIENAKESVDITNKGIYIDGVAVTTPEAFYEGYDGLLRKKYSKNYAGDLLARQAGVVLEGSNNSSGTGTRYSPFDLPTLSITTANNPNDSDDPNEEKTADQLAIEAFNKEHKTTGNPYIDDLLRQRKLYRFNAGNNNYILATKDNDGNFIKVEDNLTDLIYDIPNQDLFGNVYVGVNGVYKLFNENERDNQDINYKNAFDLIVNPIRTNLQTSYLNKYNNYSDRELWYNPITKDNNYIDIKNHFNSGYDVKSVYINPNVSKTHFGLINPKDQDAIVVISENGELVPKNVKIKFENGKYIAESSEKIKNEKGEEINKTWDLGNISKIPEVEASDKNYIDLKLDQFEGISKEDIIYDSDWSWDQGKDKINKNKITSIPEYLKNLDNQAEVLTYAKNLLGSLNGIYSEKDAKEKYMALYQLLPQYSKEEGSNYYKFKYILSQIYKKLKGEEIPSNKLGGIISKYQYGGSSRYANANIELKTNQNKSSLNSKPIEVPKDKKHTTLENVENWETSDWLKGAAVGANAVSLAGGMVGVGAGIVGTGLELAADVMDAIDGKKETSEVLKNVAINLGLTILAAIPGAASAKLAKTALKGGAKVAKSLKKVKDVANTIDSAKDASTILAKSEDVIGLKDAKNILLASEDLLKNSNFTDEAAKAAAQEVIDACNTLIKAESRKTIANTVQGVTNLGMATLGLKSGFDSGVNITSKVLNGDAEDISLEDLQGVVLGFAGARGARNLYKNYAINRALVDKNYQDISPDEIPLEFGNAKIKINSTKKNPKAVKNALKSKIDELTRKKGEISDQTEKNLIDDQIKQHQDIFDNFDDVYGKSDQFKNWSTSKVDETKSFFDNIMGAFKTPDINKRLTTEDGWLINKGKERARALGFTEDGIDWDILNKNIGKRQPWVIKLGKQKPLENSTFTDFDKSIFRLELNKITNLKELKKYLNQLSKNKNLSKSDKEEIKNILYNNNKGWKKDELDLLKFKQGGSVKIKKYETGDAFSSAEDPTKEGKKVVKLPDPNEVGGSNDYDGQISKPNNWWSKLAIVPEAINIASKTANAWAGANKIFDIQQRKEVAKKQYPYIHLPVQEDLSGYQYQKNSINEGRAGLNKNLTSDASLQTATGLEFNRQAIESTNKLNALRSQDLSNQRLKSVAQEYENEKNRIDTANYNNAVDVDLADYKRGLDAQRISTLTSIVNTNLEQNGQLFNKILDSATKLQAAKHKDALTQQYYDKTTFDNDYITRYDTYEKSPIKQYETALGIGKDEIVTQAHSDGLYNKYLEQHPNLTDDQKRSAKSGFDRLVGKTLQQYYDSAYRYHETSLMNEGRKYQSAISLADEQANYNQYFLTPSRIQTPTYKKGGSFTETKYKTDSKSKDHHKKIALEYAKLMQKQHQENMKNALPFLLHSYKNTTSK